MYSLASVFVACTMMSCVTFSVADDTKRATDGNQFPLSRTNQSHEGSTDPSSERWQDRVPREPMWVINASGGVRDSNRYPADNAKGFSIWWRGPRAVDELINRVRAGYSNGARWFLINRPMGTPGDTYVPGASWLTLDDNKRDKIPELLTQALLDEFDEPVHIVWFVGSDLSDPRSFPGWTPERDDEFYQLGRGENWEQIIGSRVTLGGWISTGASGIGIDNSSAIHKRAHYIRLFENLNGFPFYLNIYGEAYPLATQANGRASRDANGTPMLDQEDIESMPWIAATNYIEGRWPMSVESDSFPLNPETTRMFVWFVDGISRYGNEEERRALVNRYMDRGLIPITADAVIFSEALDRYRATRSSRSSSSGGNGDTRSGASSSGANRVKVSVKRRAGHQSLPKKYRPLEKKKSP
jgi:hypothetical protein